MPTFNVQSYACSVDGFEHTTVVTARSRGQAKSLFWRNNIDCMPDLPYTAIRCRSMGSPVTSDAFRRNAQYRRIPFARVGMRIKVGSKMGTIIDNNSSANLDVLFDDGQVLNCHPHHMITYYEGNRVLARDCDG